MVDPRLSMMQAILEGMKADNPAPTTKDEAVDAINTCAGFIDRVMADGQIGENEIPLLLAILQAFNNIYLRMPGVDQTTANDIAAIVAELQPPIKNYPNTMDESLHGSWSSGVKDPGATRGLSDTVRAGLTKVSEKLKSVVKDTVEKLSSPLTQLNIVNGIMDITSTLWDGFATDPVTGLVAKLVVEEAVLTVMRCAQEARAFDAGRHVPLIYRGA